MDAATTRTWARYVRVSAVMGRGEDAFLSPDLQRQALDRMITATGGRAGPVFSDIDRTGTDFNRAGIRDALAWVYERPTGRGLATYDVSRLGRNTSESLAAVKDLRRAGAVYASAAEKIDDTPEGDLALTLWLAIAEHHAARIGRTWRSVHDHRAARGLPPHGSIPLGYRREGRNVHPDPDTADALVEVFEMYARGVTLKRVAARLGELRGGHVPTQNAKRTLRNEFYVGRIRHRGEWVDGAHEPVVNPPLWAAVQQRMRDEAGQPARRAEPRSPLLGLLVCGGCGGSVQLVNNGTAVSCTQFRKRYPRDRTCAGIGAPRIATLEDALVDALGLNCWGQHLHDEPDTSTRDRAQRRLDRLERDLRLATDGRTRLALALARGALTDEAFDAASAEHEDDVTRLTKLVEEARQDVTLAPADDAERRARVLEIAQIMCDLPPTEARTRLRRDIDRIVIHRLNADRPRRPFERWDGGIEVVLRGSHHESSGGLHF